MIRSIRVATPFASAIALLAASPLAAESREPMSAQDLVTLPRLGAPSADDSGTMAVFPVTVTDPESYARHSELHIRSLTDLTAKSAKLALDGSDARFGGDGWLYYLADDADGGETATSQVWRARVSLDGSVTDAMQVSDLPRAVNGFVLSPDGGRIAVFTEIARSCASLACDDAAKPHLPGPGTGRLYQGDDGFVRHWDHWETPGTYNRTFAYTIKDGQLVGEGIAIDGPQGAGGPSGDTPTMPFGGNEDLAFAPDGKSIYFVAREADANEPYSTNLDVWKSDLDGSAPVNLTVANAAMDMLPAPSPDGRYLAYVAMERPTYEADRQVIMLRDLRTGKTKALTAAFDRSFGTIVWTPDSRWIVATAQDVLDTPAFRVDPRSGKVERLDLMAGNEAHIANVVPLNRGGLLFTRDSVGAPAEMYLARKWGQAKPLTDVAMTRLGTLAPVSVERFSFAGANGDTVWGQITKPDGVEGKLPVILYVHGGPQGSFNDSWSNRWNPRVVASQGYAVVSVDFHGSTGYGQAFTDSIRNDWGGKPLEDLQKGLAHALSIDTQIYGDRACAMGASYGGYMMNWIAGQWPERFDCLVQHDGVFDARAMAYETEELWFDIWEHGGKKYFEDPAAYERWNPANHVDKWKTPMLVITGEKDFRIPYTQGIASFTALQMRQIPSQLLVFPDENHWVLKAKNSLQWHNTVFAWLGRWLKPAE